MPDHPQIGYVGLGNIGLPMAVNISEYIKLNNLPPLAVWNRSADKYAKVPDCVGVDRIEELISKSDCDIIFTSYPNDEIATYLCPKLAMCIQQKGKTGVIIVDQSTLHPKTSVSMRKYTSDRGVIYLSAPVFGQPPAVISRNMVCAISGDNDAIDIVTPILDSLARAIIRVGESPEEASQAKLLVNMMLYESIQVLSEVYTLAEKINFPQDKLHQLFQTIVPAPPLLNYSNRISQRNFDGSTGFKLDGGIKDVKLILSLGSGGHANADVPLPTLERVLENLEKAKLLARDKAGDMSVEALSAVARDDAGLEPF